MNPADLKKTLYNTTEAYTQNGALTNATTNNFLYDFFSSAGASSNVRGGDNQNIFDMKCIDKFSFAYENDPITSLCVLSYIRDAREGQGQRRIFRKILKELAKKSDASKNDAKKFFQVIPEIGRWDDLYAFVGTSLENDAFAFLKEQFKKDIQNHENNEQVSLLAKWLKSINASSKETRRLGRLTAKHFGMSEKEYRKMLSKLRKHIDVVECKMSANEWNKIEYSHVPSIAMKNYVKAFLRNDKERFEKYIQNVKNGQEKINASVLYPHDLLNKVIDYASMYWGSLEIKNDIPQEVFETYQEQWNALPQYSITEENVIPVIDCSGSMYSGGVILPIIVGSALGTYLAEHNKGLWKNKIITFSQTPEVVSLNEDDAFYEKAVIISKSTNALNTNLQAVFDLILDTAKRNKLSDEEMPQSIIIVSDMEFDNIDVHKTNFEVIKNKFEEAGYKMPRIIFWNVLGRPKNYPATIEDVDALLFSGFSPVVIKQIMENLTIEDVIKDIIKKYSKYFL